MAIIDNNNSNFRPIDWDNMRIPYDSSNTITGTTGIITTSLPGALIDYTMEHDRDWLDASGMPKDQMEATFKKEMAVKLAEKMIADGHVVFTKQDIMHNHTVRYKAYTWVGNQSLIEQERKNKGR